MREFSRRASGSSGPFFGGDKKGIEILRAMETLEQIGAHDRFFPPAEFWNRYDAGEFAE